MLRLTLSKRSLEAKNIFVKKFNVLQKGGVPPQVDIQFSIFHPDADKPQKVINSEELSNLLQGLGIDDPNAHAHCMEGLLDHLEELITPHLLINMARHETMADFKENDKPDEPDIDRDNCHYTDDGDKY